MLLHEGPEVQVPCERENPFGDLESSILIVQMPVIRSLDSNVQPSNLKLCYIYIYIYIHEG